MLKLNIVKYVRKTLLVSVFLATFSLVSNNANAKIKFDPTMGYAYKENETPWTWIDFQQVGRLCTLNNGCWYDVRVRNLKDLWFYPSSPFGGRICDHVNLLKTITFQYIDHNGESQTLQLMRKRYDGRNIIYDSIGNPFQFADFLKANDMTLEEAIISNYCK